MPTLVVPVGKVTGWRTAAGTINIPPKWPGAREVWALPRFFAKSGAVFGFGLGRICTRGPQPRVDTLFSELANPTRATFRRGMGSGTGHRRSLSVLDGLDDFDFGDMVAEVPLDAHFERNEAGWASDACAVEADADCAGVGYIG